ncbi:MAG TPA: hypothetical protein PLD47_06500 [Aggregatilineales bacterium]|nr:hypothetical protein [Anaerolineales bacterium]HRE47361.1 hypothetical protein [Aggregatilineales bacterium]
MNRLFDKLRRIIEKPALTPIVDAPPAPALSNFDARAEVLCKHAEQAAAYETDLMEHLERVEGQLAQLQVGMEAALDAGADQQAYEILRLAARFRPQKDLLHNEITAFGLVAGALIQRVDALVDNLDEARTLAADGSLNPVATKLLDTAITRLTRYFVLLERVAQTRRRALPDRLAESLLTVIDDRQLDFELARYVMARRRALGSG